MSAGRKIIDGLKDAVAGDMDRVTIDGQLWVRRDAETERLRGLLQEARDHIGRTSTLDWNTARLVHRIEAALSNQQQADDSGNSPKK